KCIREKATAATPAPETVNSTPKSVTSVSETVTPAPKTATSVVTDSVPSATPEIAPSTTPAIVSTATPDFPDSPYYHRGWHNPCDVRETPVPNQASIRYNHQQGPRTNSPKGRCLSSRAGLYAWPA
ncbi:hypothetical protein BGZ88_006146, partial [Linnemannia elongata]